MIASDSIHELMAAILADLPAIGKVQKNEQQGFMFRGHDDVLNALNPLLAKHKVYVVPNVLDRVPAQRQTSKGSIMFEVNLHVAYRFYGPAGDYVEASAWGEGTDMGDKATNKAMTMAFKNVLNQVFAISSAETVDSDAHSAAESVSTNGHRDPDPHGFQAARADAPIEQKSDKAEDMVIHFGKNKDVRLGDLSEKSLAWYAEQWEPNDTALDRGLKQAARVLHELNTVPF